MEVPLVLLGQGEAILVLLVLAIPVCAIIALIVAVATRGSLRQAEARWRKQLGKLQEQIDRLERHDASAAPKPRPPAPQPKAEPKPAPAAEPKPAPSRPVPVPPPLPPARKEAAPEPPVAAPRPEPKPKVSLEERIGGKWFNWVGIVAILFGVAYAMKYSFDRGLITHRMRFWLGIAFGVTLLAAGAFSERRRYAILARGFWGGGIGVLFLVVFAGFKLLHDVDGTPILGRETAFAGMAATVVVGVAISILYDTRTATVLSALGGYLTPILLSTGHPDQVFLFTYLSILTGGLLVLGHWKRWVFLRPLTFGVVVLYFSGWWATEGVGAPWAMLFYAGLMFLLFSGETVAWSAFRRVIDESWSHFLLGLNTALHGLIGLTVLERHFPAWQGAFLLANSAWYLGGALLVRRRHPEDRMLLFSLSHLACVLFLLAPVFEPRAAEHRMSMIWALQGAALFYAADRLGAGTRARLWGFVALGLAAARLLALDTPRTLAHVEPYLPFWNARGLAFGAVILAYAFACWRTSARDRAGIEYHAGTGLWILGLSLPAVLLSLELAQGLDTYVEPRFETSPRTYAHQSSHWMTLLWGAYATLVATVTGRRGALALRNVALGFGAFVLVKYVVRDLAVTYATQATPLVNSRFGVTVALAACLFWTAREFKALAVLARFARDAAHVLLLAGACMEWVDFCAHRGVDAGFWRDASLHGLTILIAGYGTALLYRGPRHVGIAFVAAAAVKWLALDLTAGGMTAALFWQIRFLAAAAAATACFVAALRDVPARLGIALRVAGHVLAVAALGSETRDLFAREHWSPRSPLSVLRLGAFFVTATWAVYGRTALHIGLRLQRRHLRALGMVLIAVSLAVGLVLLPGAARAERLFLNTRLLGLAATVVGLLWAAELYRRRDLRIDAPWEIERAETTAALVIAGHGLAMVLLTLEAADYFHRAGADAVRAEWIDANSARQLSYSLIWALYAIGMVVAGLLRKYRPVRLMALGVLAVTVLKVFLFDLSFLENPYRMFSFLVLGSILVGVSFLYQKYKTYLV